MDNELNYEEFRAPPSGYDPSWRQQAACRNVDTDLFFPVGDKGPTAKRQIEAAKAICRLCDVQQSCLEYAVRTNQENGVWGGASEAELNVIKRRWKRVGRIAS